RDATRTGGELLGEQCRDAEADIRYSLLVPGHSRRSNRMARRGKSLSSSTKKRIGSGVAKSWARLSAKERAARVRQMTAWRRKRRWGAASDPSAPPSPASSPRRRRGRPRRQPPPRPLGGPRRTRRVAGELIPVGSSLSPP